MFQSYYSIQLNSYGSFCIIIKIILMLLAYKISQINEAINFQSIDLATCEKSCSLKSHNAGKMLDECSGDLHWSGLSSY